MKAIGAATPMAFGETQLSRKVLSMLMPDRDGKFKEYNHAEAQKCVARRSFIAAAATATIALAVPASAVVADTPVLQIYRKYKAIREESLWADDADMETYYALFDSMEAAIATMPSTCAADFAAKMLVTHCNGDYSLLGSNDPVWAEARALVEGVA